MTETLEPPAAAPPVVPVWSPVTVAVYGLLLGFPAGVMLALRNWRALGMRREVRTHLAGAFVVALVIFFVLPRLVRYVSGGTSIAAFIYLKAKLRSDFEDAQPSVTLLYRPWYTALGWALLADAAFILFAAVVTLVVCMLC
ncbi:MAG TPA: hypothetical protein VF824_02210 [Thermoanaerobaculia bacterium]